MSETVVSETPLSRATSRMLTGRTRIVGSVAMFLDFRLITPDGTVYHY
jgi:hypothetical protein